MFSVFQGLFIFVILLSSPVSPDRIHERTTQIVIQTPEGKTSCGATVVSKHALLTARHCLDDMRGLIVNGKPVKVIMQVDDDGDHSLIVVDQVFNFYVPFTIVNPKLGESVYIFGNPGRYRDLLRKGYVAGIIPPEKDRDFNSTVYDFNGFFGDSGSGIFNEQGQLVGVVSYIIKQNYEGLRWKVMASNPINFTLEQIETVEKFK